MVAKKETAGDPARLLELLWRSSRPEAAAPRHGPKPSLSVDALVARAMTIADAEGLEALTIRRLASELGVATMSVYTYVSNRSELISLMIDAAYLELSPDMPEGPGRSGTGRADTQPPAGPDWRTGVEGIARENFALYQRHPWLIELYFSERPPLGPGIMRKYERELGVFEGTGLDDVEMDAALSFVLNFVRSAARDARQSARSTNAEDNAAWWQAVAPVLDRVMPAGAFPLSERVGSAAGALYGSAYSAGYAYTFGLARVLDGLANLIASRQA